MASQVEICNLALTRIAASRIISLGDDTISARDCSAVFDFVAENVMSMGSWPSVKRRASLAQLDTTPAFQYTYAYQLPVDPKCLRVIDINSCRPGDIDFTIEGDQLLINESSVSIKYLAFISDTNSYDVYLRQAIVDHLAAELTYKQTGQLSAYKASLDYAKKHAEELLAIASLAGSSEALNSDTFIDARYSSFPDDSRLRD